MPKPNRTCVLTGFQFYSQDPEAQVAPEAVDLVKSIVCGIIVDDKDFRTKVMTAMLEDEEISAALSSAVLATKANDIGLPTSGSIADLFCKKLRKSGNKKASKTSR